MSRRTETNHPYSENIVNPDTSPFINCIEEIIDSYQQEYPDLSQAPGCTELMIGIGDILKKYLEDANNDRNNSQESARIIEMSRGWIGYMTFNLACPNEISFYNISTDIALF